MSQRGIKGKVIITSMTYQQQHCVQEDCHPKQSATRYFIFLHHSEQNCHSNSAHSKWSLEYIWLLYVVAQSTK